MGTWKLNEAKSKLSAGGPRNHTVAYTAAGDSVKVTVEGVDAEGKPARNEWTGKFDGKDYPVTGAIRPPTCGPTRGSTTARWSSRPRKAAR